MTKVYGDLPRSPIAFYWIKQWVFYFLPVVLYDHESIQFRAWLLWRWKRVQFADVIEIERVRPHLLLITFKTDSVFNLITVPARPRDLDELEHTLRTFRAKA